MSEPVTWRDIAWRGGLDGSEPHVSTPQTPPEATPDATACPVCNRENCEDQTHVPPGDDGSPISDEQPARTVPGDDARRRLRLVDEMARQRISREARRRLDAEDCGEIIEPEMIPLSVLVAEREPAITYRIEGWQPTESRVILAAARKTGKTTLMVSLARSLIDGDPWLGVAAVHPVTGTVAILDTEMSRAQLRRWFGAQRIQAADRVLIVPLRGRAGALNLMDRDCRAGWAGRLRAHRVQYLIVDCLRPILDALGLDEAREAGRWLVGLDALLAEAGIPEACVVHHMGHVAERSRGDSRLRDWPDVEWRLVRHDNTNDASPRYLAAYGRDVDVSEQRLDYDASTRRLTLVGGSRVEARKTQALDAVIEVLNAATKPLTGRGIKDALQGSDHSRDSIDAALKFGVRERRLTVEDGPRRSQLYKVSVRVSGSVPPVSGAHSTESVSECPTASIEADTQDTPELPLDKSALKQESGHSKPRRRPARTATRNTARTRRQAAGENA